MLRERNFYKIRLNTFPTAILQAMRTDFKYTHFQQNKSLLNAYKGLEFAGLKNLK